MASTNYRKHNKRICSYQCITLSSLILNLLLLTTTAATDILSQTKAATHPVYTYKNASTSLGQLVTSSTLLWESYDPKDAKQLEYAVQGGKYVTEDEHYSIFVCRVNIDGVPTSGHTEKVKQLQKCVAAHYRHGKYDHFDVLVNRGHLGKISWKPWRTFNAGIPIGAVAIGEDGYIGRHRAIHHPTHTPDGTLVAETHWGADYHFGRLEPNVGLGKIKVLENETERYYDDGEVLVETEPFRYELSNIKLDQIRLDLRENVTELTTAVLANRDDKYGRVELAMTYAYDYIQYWGTQEGAARGLPTTIFEKDEKKPTEINWGLKYSEHRYETKNVHTMLWPGTAINVTLRGNYVTLESPYTAKLHAFYYGSDETVSRKITADVRKSYLKDVKLQYSPVYWLANGSFVPTTTTTSTTSTTARSTTSTNDPVPMHEPPVVHVNHQGEFQSGSESLDDSPAVISNEVDNEMPENLSEKHQKHALAGVALSNESNKNSATTTTKTTTLTWNSLVILAIILMQRIEN